MTLDKLLRIKKAMKHVSESIIISASMVTPLYLGLNLSCTPEQLIMGITESTAYLTTIKIMLELYYSHKNNIKYK